MKITFIYFLCGVLAVFLFFHFNTDLVLAHRANQAYLQADYSQATQDYIEAIQHGYSASDGLIHFVESLQRSGLLKNNTDLCLEFMSSGSLDTDSLFAMAGAFEGIQSWEMAAAAYDRIIQTGHATDIVLLQRARVAGYAGQWENSIHYLHQLLGDDL